MIRLNFVRLFVTIFVVRIFKHTQIFVLGKINLEIMSLRPDRFDNSQVIFRFVYIELRIKICAWLTCASKFMWQQKVKPMMLFSILLLQNDIVEIFVVF